MQFDLKFRKVERESFTAAVNQSKKQMKKTPKIAIVHREFTAHRVVGAIFRTENGDAEAISGSARSCVEHYFVG